MAYAAPYFGYTTGNSTPRRQLPPPPSGLFEILKTGKSEVPWIEIASFIKTHIFSPSKAHLWLEVHDRGRGRGSVSRLHSVSDESIQPFREEKTTTFTSSVTLPPNIPG